MSTYNGLFLRSTLAATNTIPKPGAQSMSPDIIPYGPTPVANPAATFSDYGKDYGTSIQAKVPNYVYMRAKNYAENSLSEPPRLFSVPAALLSFPSTWTEITATGSGSKPSIAAAAGAVGIIDTPFVWSPDNPGSNGGYSLIGMVPSPGYPNPDEILKSTSVPDLASVVAQTGGLAWRNIVTIPTSNIDITFKQAYNQGTEGEKMQVTLICKNLPLTAKVSFSAGSPGTSPAFYLPPTQVTTSPFITGIVVDIPANWASDIYMTMSAPAGTVIPPDASMTMQVSYPVNADSELFQYAHSPAELAIPTPATTKNNILRHLFKNRQGLILQPQHKEHINQIVRLNAALGPTRLIVVGGYTVIWKDT